MVERKNFFINAISNAPKEKVKVEDKKTEKKPRKKKGEDK